jgi:hypothetical protein
MAEHVLKCWPNAFDAIRDGRKRFEWRRDDRGYEVRDVLVLRKWDPNSNGYVLQPWDGKRSGSMEPEQLRVRVTYILRGQFGVPPDFCVMSVEPEEAAEALAKEGK